MKPRTRSLHLALCAALACGAGCSASSEDGGGEPTPSGLTADHRALDVAAIPQGALDAARGLRMNLQHASVGENVWAGLGALAAADPGRYAKPSWSETNRGNPGWQAKIDGFVAYVAAHAGDQDVFQMKLCYIDDGADFAAYRDAMVALEAAHPTKTFVWWTMPLTTGDGANAARALFNQQVRAHCAAHGAPLFDLAAIESHDAGGAAVVEAGVEAMAPAWSSDGGHLTAAGSDRAARAMWWLMARVAGWSGG